MKPPRDHKYIPIDPESKGRKVCPNMLKKGKCETLGSGQCDEATFWHPNIPSPKIGLCLKYQRDDAWQCKNDQCPYLHIGLGEESSREMQKIIQEKRLSRRARVREEVPRRQARSATFGRSQATPLVRTMRDAIFSIPEADDHKTPSETRSVISEGYPRGLRLRGGRGATAGLDTRI